MEKVNFFSPSAESSSPFSFFLSQQQHHFTPFPFILSRTSIKKTMCAKRERDFFEMSFFSF